MLPRRPRRVLQQRHQPPQPLRPLQLQRRQRRRPPAQRHVFVKSTAASAALRGCVPRCCSPHPRWRKPLWAEEVCAGCACQQSTAGICVRPLWSDLLNKRKL
ncbi:putative mucin TcMUCII [Trypanosoma cruzi Dm28c]|uniref:Putative mucin TcMUCII n=1 Tax=Trypanosoma cruzi Dm28c TaxID=1416333 RepID=V5B1H7_TRYCR|nr:putative mucin TcMUCII [Trypanosoma cruzi Dm28c]